jgi:hypothetical protein
MHSSSRRAVALLAATATLAAGSLASAAQASAATAGSADSSSVRSAGSLIDVVVSLVLSLLGANPTVGQVQTQAAGLTPSQLGGLLQGAGPGQLTAILGGGLNPTQLTSAVTSLATAGELSSVLGTLTAAQTGDLLAPLTGGTLSGVLSLLDSSQILGALGTLDPAELSSVAGGLAPAQVGSLLSTANPTQLTSLVGGLTGGQLGGGLALLNTAQLTSLLAIANAALAGVLPGADTTPLQGLITTVTTLLGSGSGPGGGGTTVPPGITIPRGIVPAGSGRGAAAAAKPAAFTGYRASVGSIKVAKNRRSAKMTVSCPAAAPVGCVVTLKGVVAGRKAFAGKPFVLLRKAKRTLTTKLSGATTRHLKKKGGSLRVSALTMFSTLPTTTKTVRVARTR